jgi:enterochelin esterase-like enzyme
MRSALLAIVLTACSASSSSAPSQGEVPPEAGAPEAGAPPPDAGEPPPSSSDAAASDAGRDACVPPDPGTAGDGNVTIGPTYTDAPELTVNAGVPRGTIYQFTMSSTTSQIYPGLNGPYTRQVWVYVPKQYVDGAPAALLVVQDGGSYVSLVTLILDNLINNKKLPVIVAVLINSGGGDGRGSERGLEYDRVSPTYVQFIETEVLPIVPLNADIQKTYKHLTLTTDPDGRAAMGGSSGGAAAFTMGWFRPDLYKRILTYSGTFVNQYPEAAYPHGAWEYHEHLLAATPAKPLRVFLEVGENDNNLDAQFGDGMHNWMTANKAMAAQLGAKGYHYRFEYALGATHVDGRVLRQTMPEALLWLWRGYPSACSR